MFLIKDWTGNILFDSKEFETFDDAEDFLCGFLNDEYEELRQEYFVSPYGRGDE